MGRFFLEVHHLFKYVAPLLTLTDVFSHSGSEIFPLLHRTVCHNSNMVLPECKSTLLLYLGIRLNSLRQVMESYFAKVLDSFSLFLCIKTYIRILLFFKLP